MNRFTAAFILFSLFRISVAGQVTLKVVITNLQNNEGRVILSLMDINNKDIKAFYMKQNDDGKTVAAADLEVPGAGELIGASQREENYDKLAKRMEELNMQKEGMEWYMNLRKFGGCVHSGFGMGFERLIMYLTGVENIRDVIPFPRTPKNCEY